MLWSLGTTYRTTQHPIPGDLNPQLHHCDNLKSQIKQFMHKSQGQIVISQNKTELKDGTLIHKSSSQPAVCI